MKVTPRFFVRAALVVTAGGVIGAFGACKDSTQPNPPAAPPPPPPPLTAPAVPTVQSVDTVKVNLVWTYGDNTATGFRLDRCSGAACTNFAQVGTNLAGTARAFTDSGLTNHTQYSYRLRALRGADTSAWSPTVTATTGAVVSGSGTFTMLAAGEISTGLSSAGPTATAKLVSDMLAADPNAFAMTLGNNLADATAGSKLAGSTFDKTWGLGGTFSARAYYAIGNADFDGGRGPSDVYGYFKNVGTPSQGWYSFDKGTWHIVVLNTSDWEHGAGPTFGTHFDAATKAMVLDPSAQVDWLAADLQAARANGAKCIAVVSWERRFYTSGSGAVERQANMRPMSQVMAASKVDLVISAKDKLYERFAPMNWDNAAADPNGFRQFIVGTGGRSSDGLPAGNPATREAAFADQWGVLKLTLGDGNYSFEFVNTNSAGPTDKSAAPVACHQ